jgi:hypothetical protein
MTFDDISKSPDDLVDWYMRGQDYKEWDYKALVTLQTSSGLAWEQ